MSFFARRSNSPRLCVLATSKFLRDARGRRQIRRPRLGKPRAAGKSVSPPPESHKRRPRRVIAAGNATRGGQAAISAPGTLRTAANRRNPGREVSGRFARAVYATREVSGRFARALLVTRQESGRFDGALLVTRQESRRFAGALFGTRQESGRFDGALLDTRQGVRRITEGLQPPQTKSAGAARA